MIANFQKELVVVWTIISIITIAILLLPFIFTDQTIIENTPTCISIKKYNKQCFMCGMSRGFIQISKGNLLSAQQLNGGSIVLYCSFLLNAILCVAFWLRNILKPLHIPLHN